MKCCLMIDCLRLEIFGDGHAFGVFLAYSTGLFSLKSWFVICCLAVSKSFLDLVLLDYLYVDC